MDKINFQNLPNKDEPINAENLNKMQDNVENAISILENMINGTVLYSDSDLTTITENLTITLNDDLSNYTYYEVWASRFANAPGWITTGKIPVGMNAFLTSPEGGAGAYFRDIDCDVSTNTIIARKNTDGHEMRCIPRMVKGYKY